MEHKLVGIVMHNGANLFIPKLGVVTGIDISEGGKHAKVLKELTEEPSGKVNVFWVDDKNVLQKSSVGAANIVSYKYEPVRKKEEKK